MADSPPPRPDGCASWLAIVAAAAPVSVIIAVASGLLRFLPFVMGVTMMIAMLAGAPILAMLRARGRISWRSVASGGFIAGAAIPLLLSLWAIPQALVNAATNRGGWIDGPIILIQFIGGFGLAGTIGAFITWGLLIWLGIGRATGGDRRWKLGLLIVFVVGSIFGGAAVPGLFVDRSCHNPTRDGRPSITPVAGFELHIPVRDWPALRGELQRFAATSHWSYLDPMPPNPDTQWFDVSLCVEPGTQIGTTYIAAGGDKIIFTVVQPQGGDSWKLPVLRLQRRLEARWPGRVSYQSGPTGEPAPPWPIAPVTSNRSAPAPGDQASSQR